MNKKFNNIIKSIKLLVLSKEEKDQLFTRVDNYVKNHPVYVTENSPSFRPSIFSIISPYFVHTQKAFAFAVVFLFVAVGGGTSLAAQKALPGGALYGIKVHVNEEVQSWFTFGAESKAYFEVKRVGERLEEAKTLAVMGQLDATKKDEIQKNIKEHVKEVKAQIATIEASNDLTTAINVSETFEKSLKEHGKSLAKIEAQQNIEKIATKVAIVNTEIKNTDTASSPEKISVTSKMSVEVPEEVVVTTETLPAEGAIEDIKIVEPQTEIGELVSTIQENIDASAQVRKEVEIKIQTVADEGTRKTIAEEKQKSAHAQIDKVTSFIVAGALDLVPATATSSASSTLSQAKILASDGDAKLDSKSYTDAFLLFKQALEKAEKAEEMLATSTVSIISVTEKTAEVIDTTKTKTEIVKTADELRASVNLNKTR